LIHIHLQRDLRLAFSAVSFLQNIAFQKFKTFEKLCVRYTCGEAGFFGSKFSEQRNNSLRFAGHGERISGFESAYCHS
jgi:hypothetical protein